MQCVHVCMLVSVMYMCIYAKQEKRKQYHYLTITLSLGFYDDELLCSQILHYVEWFTPTVHIYFILDFCTTQDSATLLPETKKKMLQYANTKIQPNIFQY